MNYLRRHCLTFTLSMWCLVTLLACMPPAPAATEATPTPVAEEEAAAGTIPAAEPAGTIPAAPAAGTIPAADAETAAPLDLQQAYAAALQDAKTADPDEIFDGLTAITPDDPTLTWQAESGRVLMVSWTSWNGYDALVGQETKLTREVWATAVPQLQSFCQTYVATDALPLTLRLEGLLGLPANNGKSRFVAMWVNPTDMFRPSPDGEIDDTVAELVLPGPERFPSQQDYEFHRDWYNLQLTLQNYDDPSKGYPWTRLGYTYDWTNPESEIGLSEFVIAAGATVGIEQVYTNEAYCGS